MSLRLRLVLSYIVIVIICLGIAAISLSVLLQGYRDRTSIANLNNATRPIYNQVRALLRGQTSLADIWTIIEEQAQTNNIFILFVNDKGDVVRMAAPDSNSNQQFDVPGGLPNSISGPESGIFTVSSGQQYVYSAYPLTRIDPILPRPTTMVLAEPRGSVAALLASLIVPFVWAGIIALVISLLLAFLLARSVYHPIQRLSKAAGNIAQGHYDEPVPESGPAEIKGLATSFNEMALKVKASQEQLRHFVADVSHQLKTPLTSIKGFAEAIMDGTASDQATREKAVKIIVDESNRMIRQVNELLDLSRMQAGQLKIARERVDVAELLLHSQEIFAMSAEGKKIKFIDNIRPQLQVTGDADRLEDVFCNLLDNAIKNTPVQGQIYLDASNQANSVKVSIADTGPGIPPEQIPHVFDRFTQSSGLRSGFGLGLAIAREIVLAHSGQIEVSSNPGEGAKFTVTLPVAKQPKSHDQ